MNDQQGKKIFHNYTRITGETMFLLRSIEDRITKSNTRMRTAIPAGLKLACTLRFLATGDSLHSFCYDFSVAHNTVSKFIPEVLEAVLNLVRDQVFPPINGAEGWRR